MIITCTNLKGGCSKTTTAIAFATAAKNKKQKVKVIDTDPQGSATEWAYLAQDAGAKLPFEVESKNVQSIQRLPQDETAQAGWIFIDTPPTGNITDEAIRIADFVVVPVTPSAIDMRQTWATIRTLSAQDINYAVLITRANPQTKAFKSMVEALDEAEVPYFTTTIPQREAIKNNFGFAFNELYGYEKAFAELSKVLKNMDK